MPPPMLTLVLLALAVNPYLERASAQVAVLKFDEALIELEAAEHVPGITLPERLTVLELRGRCQVALGHRAEAERAFSAMLELEPRAALEGGTSPKIREVFDAAKLRLYPDGYVKLTVLPDLPGRVRALLIDPWARVDSLRVRWRARADAPWAEAPLTRGADAVWTQKVPSPGEWYLEARAASGERVVSDGGPERPHGDLGPEVARANAPPLAVAAAPAFSTGRKVGVGAALAGAVTLSLGVLCWGLSGASHGDAKRQEWGDAAFAAGSRSATQASWGNGLFATGLLFALAGTMVALAW